MCDYEPEGKRAKGVEPSTFTLAKGEYSAVSKVDAQLMRDDQRSCTRDCTPDIKTRNGDTFTEALSVIATLPLTDIEKAEAVRRRLASGFTGHAPGITAVKQTAPSRSANNQAGKANRRRSRDYLH